MKKQSINYLLVTLVLSLCILIYYRTAEGFQTSPVDFTNYTGQLTGIRIKLTATTNQNPTVVFQQLLGNNMSEMEITSMFERCNGDSVLPYYATGIMGSSNEVREMIWPESYQALTSPAVMTAMLSNDNAAIQNAMLSAFPIYNMNFTRNSRLAPVNLVNQNIQTVFNNIYGNLQKNGVILQSVILDNTNEYPRKICANQQAPALSPKINVNANTALIGLTIQSSLAIIFEIFELSQAPQLPTITRLDETGNSVPVDVSALIASVQGGQTSGSSMSQSMQSALSEISVVRTYTISLQQGMPLYGMASSTMFFSQSRIYTQQYSSYFYTGSSYFSDSVIQAYYTQLFIAYNGYMLFRASTIGARNQSSSKPVFNIISYRLSNPAQDYTLGIEGAVAGSSGGGGGISSSNTPSGTTSGSDASLLQSLRNLLCV
jgi:hypothetical protein